jgi:hypothetical protein
MLNNLYPTFYVFVMAFFSTLDQKILVLVKVHKRTISPGYEQQEVSIPSLPSRVTASDLLSLQKAPLIHLSARARTFHGVPNLTVYTRLNGGRTDEPES